ncbi:MAG TPA: NAD-dependent epimerase/dehydratase family protein [Rhizomicrobium sp.]|nr:NAD-dependent epimerase/dehydratase family protein [Rhizomicrobium sp.]
MAAILVTGAAGFIGAAVCHALLARGDTVMGIDNLSDYYDVRLKDARLAQLAAHKNFSFRKADIADKDAMLALAGNDVAGIVHLAAQPGVRYSLENPFAYVTANVMGQAVMLELARALQSSGRPALKHFVYASSSSVYGANKKTPFAVGDAVDHPNSLYAATKRSDELFAHTYAHLYGIACTGLRFFTVYGPWGRPDMAPILFASAIAKDQPITVFNHGEMWRDFTYIDDIVAGVLRALDRPAQSNKATGTPPHALYNLGNNKSEKLTDFIAEIEKAMGKKAQKIMAPMQPGDVPSTYADIEASTRDLGFAPATPISVGIPKFVAWFRDYYRV